jgi:UDP-N-acetyl-D-mannosaminuronic acid dehydrogenase
MLVNEGLVNHVIRGLKREFSHALREKTLGILGMAFKADVDDARDSLSFKLRKLGQVECKNVLCTDVHIQDPTFVSVDEVLRHADIIVLAAPHKEYAAIRPEAHAGKRFVDVWNYWSPA